MSDRPYNMNFAQTCHDIRGICTKCAVPDPSLMALKSLLVAKFEVRGDGPDFDCCVSGTGREVSVIDEIPDISSS
jgi:hypothetical protein